MLIVEERSGCGCSTGSRAIGRRWWRSGSARASGEAALPPEEPGSRDRAWSSAAIPPIVSARARESLSEATLRQLQQALQPRQYCGRGEVGVFLRGAAPVDPHCAQAVGGGAGDVPAVGGLGRRPPPDRRGNASSRGRRRAGRSCRRAADRPRGRRRSSRRAGGRDGGRKHLRAAVGEDGEALALPLQGADELRDLRIAIEVAIGLQQRGAQRRIGDAVGAQARNRAPPRSAPRKSL